MSSKTVDGEHTLNVNSLKYCWIYIRELRKNNLEIAGRYMWISQHVKCPDTVPVHKQEKKLPSVRTIGKFRLYARQTPLQTTPG